MPVRACEQLDECPISLIGGRRRPRPGQGADGSPCRVGRPAPMPDQKGCVSKARAVMPRHAMKKDGLAARVRHEVGRLAHLRDGRLRSAHRNDDPVNARFGHNLGLPNVLGIIPIDRGECHDGLDALACDDRPQRVRSLPSTAHQSALDDDPDPFFAAGACNPSRCGKRHRHDRRR